MKKSRSDPQISKISPFEEKMFKTAELFTHREMNKKNQRSMSID